ncbi:SDR family oxidoreductase [Microbacterium hominis]|uniref:SDR family oxidoreductase n=1 Tax=Microbacterium hominis TaxID=162426 RepID=A0A7D4U400_9MICO|nr:SDR family oxidoreductase [Microbacterium hominis]QKJ19025.1 SDR family oxidoreductase [Microbacterium hominis]
MASILFLGGTGTISAACVRRAVERGHEVTVLNRGTARRAIPDSVRVLQADLRDPASVRDALGDRSFDVVCQFVAFAPEHVRADVALFEGRCGQYVFISSASTYEKPPRRLPITESTPLRNPYWQYSRDKIACEDVLVGAFRERGFPITIVRPSHTYDEQILPTIGGWTDVARMRDGRPVVVHGDGTSLWTLTHADDFAVGFVGLLGTPLALGDSFTITGSHAPTWNQIYEWVGAAAGIPSPELVHVASDTFAVFAPERGPSLLGDKTHSAVFDCTKIQALVPEFATTITFDEGARRVLGWFDAHPEAQRVDPERDAAFDRMVAHARSAG